MTMLNEMNDKTVEMVTDIATEVAKDVYDDAGRPIMKPTGELIGLVPRAIKAALSPIEKWALCREFNVEQTKKLLENKLQNVSPELIEPPEPHIAVPAMQYISYCMDNDELRDMYANLLANSMNKVVKNGVHPSFVEIIKQLCPDEARILRYFAIHGTIPKITLRCDNGKGEGYDVISNFSNVGELTQCENPYDTNKYFDNLIRLGLIESAEAYASLTRKSVYDPLKSHKIIQKATHDIEKREDEYNKSKIDESFMNITAFGKSFCDICLSAPDIIQAKAD